MDNLNQNSDFILYTSQDGEVRVDVFINDETVWLTQKAMQELFDRSKSTVSEHISNVFKEGELDENQGVRKFRTTADDGKDYEVSYYNLDVIISVGYRIKSQRGTQFRIWATKTLKEFRCNGQNSGYFLDLIFKWTKFRLFFCAISILLIILFIFVPSYQNGSRLCWRATCQG